MSSFVYWIGCHAFFYQDIPVPQRMHTTDFGEPLTFSACANVKLTFVVSTEMFRWISIVPKR